MKPSGGVILEALKAASGQISGHGGAAERLGLKRTTLQNKMRRLGICKGDYQTHRSGIPFKERTATMSLPCLLSLLGL